MNHKFDIMSTFTTIGERKVWRDEAGNRHREDGPAYVFSDPNYGREEWYIHGKLHRINEPAMMTSRGDQSWWVHGKLHRLNGPAVQFRSGKHHWWIMHKRKTKEEVQECVGQRNLKVLLLARAINPFCEINVARYVLSNIPFFPTHLE